MKKKIDKKDSKLIGMLLDLALVSIVPLAILLVLAGLIMQPYQESKTYNKLTGAETTWWDAIWVELRVESQPVNK